ncbi:MAG: DUF2934 domain-containing protein [Bauldia sp.]|mgnify:CR=1 FL=1
MDTREEQIRLRAYQIWEAAGCPSGLAETHWHQASAEIDAIDAVPATKPQSMAAKVAARIAPAKAVAKAKKLR